MAASSVSRVDLCHHPLKNQGEPLVSTAPFRYKVLNCSFWSLAVVSHFTGSFTTSLCYRTTSMQSIGSVCV